MSIQRIAAQIAVRKYLSRPLSEEDKNKLCDKLVEIIAPEPKKFDRELIGKVAFLPMNDLFPEELPSKWN